MKSLKIKRYIFKIFNCKIKDWLLQLQIIIFEEYIKDMKSLKIKKI